MYRLVRPLLFRLDPERAHEFSLGAVRASGRVGRALARGLTRLDAPVLRQTVWGLPFDNPVGMAAGLDKNGRLIPFWAALGFGFVEIGSVSAAPSAGNPRPRLFRLPADRALINRMGLNNEGAEAVAARLEAEGPTRVPLGINLAKTHDPTILGEAAIADFRFAFARLAPQAGYVVLNVSCPNTAEGKTFEEPEALDSLLRAVFAERLTLGLEVRVVVKLSPPPEKGFDPALVDEQIAVCLNRGVAGFVATNTASDRAGLTADSGRISEIGRGGLSGRPLAARSRTMVRHLYRRVGGTLPIIGVGGIDSAEAAYLSIRQGASLVELYTGLVYEGPGLVRRVKRGLATILDRDGFRSVSDAVGVDA